MSRQSHDVSCVCSAIIRVFFKYPSSTVGRCVVDFSKPRSTGATHWRYRGPRLLGTYARSLNKGIDTSTNLSQEHLRKIEEFVTGQDRRYDCHTNHATEKAGNCTWLNVSSKGITLLNSIQWFQLNQCKQNND